MIRTLTLAMLLLLAAWTGAKARETLPADTVETRVRSLYRAQKWQEGKKLLDSHWEHYSDRSVMNELMGQYFFNSGQYDKARFYLVRSLRDDPSNLEALDLIVRVEDTTGNYSSAICYINESLEYNPYDINLWRRKIALYRKQGNDIEADRLLTRLRQIYPDDARVRNDITAMNEDRLKAQRAAGDIPGQIESLRQLTQAYPKETDYWLALSNLLLQSGREAEAREVLASGIAATGSVALIRKRAGILGDQGRYTEAVNYLRSMQRQLRLPALAADIADMERAAAESAVLNDPYTAMARVYATQHDPEALRYLLNTSIARGYYGDALTYIDEARARGDNSRQLQYMEYLVHKRLGNTRASHNALNAMYVADPTDADVADELAAFRQEEAIKLINDMQYQEAIPLLEFVEKNAGEPEARQNAMLRLFNCYLETGQYAFAHRVLDRLYTDYAYANYPIQLATLLNAEHRTPEALSMLQEAFRTADPDKARLIAYQYEEIATPYIKDLIERGMIPAAYAAAEKALKVCPDSNTFLHQAITTADLLGKKTDYDALVASGRKNFPDDPYFIVKEAGVKADAGNYRGALDMIRPQMDIFTGDSTLLNAYAAHSLSLAMEQRRSGDYSGAIATLDSALAFTPRNPELLYIKGLVYESKHDFDSAYTYQQNYKPTLMDFQEHKRHLEELRSRSFTNEIAVSYQYARPGAEDAITANASVGYTLIRPKDSYNFSVHYAGRDGMAADQLGKEDMEAGGTGIMLGFNWSHASPSSPWSVSLGGAWANRYFPRFTFNGSLAYDINGVWQVNLHASARNIRTFTRHYEWIENPEKYEPTDPDSVYVATRWDGRYTTLYSVGAGVNAQFDLWNIGLSADGFLMDSKLYVNGQVSAKFLPIEGSRTNIFANAGVGTAPQTELLDSSMPAGFSKLNTFAGAGLMWFFNRHIGASLTGTWYTMYRSQKIQTGIWGNDASTITTTSRTDYKNMFYVQAQVVISF